MHYKEKTIADTLRKIESKYGTDRFPRMIAGAYALLLARKNGLIDVADLKAFLKNTESDIQIRMFLQQHLENHWEEYRKYITAFEEADIKESIMTMELNDMRSYMQGMPDELKDIVISSLDIHANDHVADFGAGSGEFLCYALKKNPKAQYWGNEIGTDACAIAKIRAAVIGEKNIEIVQEDMFSGAKSSDMKFDKCFCFPPFGMRLGKMANVEKFLLTQSPSLPIINGNCSGEWLFALKILSCIKKHGRAVLIMPVGGLFNQLDNSIRKYFLERKMIETVIKLPARLLASTAIQTALVVFSNRNNENVKLIDASDMAAPLSDFSARELCKLIEGINENKFTWSSKKFENTHILLAAFGEEKISRLTEVDYRDLIKRGNLDPSYYLRESIHIPCASEFSTVIEEIFRGALISSAELAEISSEVQSGYRYLTPGGIQNGVIADDLPFLSDKAEKYNRYSVNDGDLVITKMGMPFKVAIAEIPEGKTVIANGNVFVIRINEDNADRYYIKAFLESAKGQALLARVAVGSAAPMLTITALKDMSISLPPLQKQLEVSCRYKAKMNEIVLLKRKLVQAMASLGQILTSTEE